MVHQLEVISLTDMKRISVSFDEDIDRGIFELRKDDEYLKCSYSEIVRRLVRIGLNAEARKRSEVQANGGV